MNKNVVAIVGRPNVGKSTLFNRISKSRSAIVDYEEGVTRDRKYTEVEWTGKKFVLVDTGGIIPFSDNKIDKAVKYQAKIAIDEADLVIFVVDAKVGVTDMDMEIAQTLRKEKDKVLVVANKVDNEKDEMELYEFLQFGLGEVMGISASNGRNTGNFLGQVMKHVDILPAEEHDNDMINVAIVGKPNVGKSSILNRLIGEDVTIVTDIPGTTRDSIDSKIKYKEKKIVFIDTAGLRRKTKIKYGVEYFSTMRTIHTIKRSEVALLILDVTQPVSNQEQKIASFAARNYKNIIVILNKWDLVDEEKRKKAEDFISHTRRVLRFVDYAPIIFTSALHNRRIHQILEQILKVDKESKKRISTSKLNKFLEKAKARFAPTHPSGKHVQIYYCTQQKIQPPSFVFFMNNPKLITKRYRRYLENQIRKTYKFEGATIKLSFKGRDKNEPLRTV